MRALTVEASTRAALDRLAGGLPSIGIALSGGGDSVALLHITARWAGPRRVMAATVDHGLRAEAAGEAKAAGRAAQALGIAHETLEWRGHRSGNLMANARAARAALLADWAARHGLAAVVLGHTRDDLAETLMMRLARGAGVDGLAAMDEARTGHGTLWLRPMLAVGRDALRDWLRGQGIPWVDDPSNENPDYDRARIRAAIAGLRLPTQALADSAAHLRQAREALSWAAARVCSDARIVAGSVRLDLARFTESPAEIRRRILIAALRFFAGPGYPPRRSQTDHALNALMAGGRATLAGMILTPDGDRLCIIREPAAAARATPLSADGIWDNRWHISGLRATETVSALGYDGLTGFDWRAAGLARDEAAATPAIRQGAEIIAAPALVAHPRLGAKPLRGADDFRDMFFAH
ncbi:MAG: tRNA lysidine(34) synthetase TilS [Paracoccus sp. (in: a-proteobacteria)]|nr:tRNA lysidine(34) synthetase TilS [Paracoccus sp. (in: a-proteobacteria)]